jgi:hypothetical protein
MKQYASIDDTVYFWFAGNDTSGSGGDGASPAADVRLAGAAADAAPVYSPTPVLLSNAGYPAGAYEIAIAATAGNGFTADNTYAVFCTLAIDAQNPTGFIGSFDTKAVNANAIEIEGTDPTDTIRDAVVDDATRIDASALNTLSGHDPGANIAKAGDLMGLANDAITSAKYDESTAFPLKSDDAGASQIARVGADGDTLETLSDQLDGVPTAAENVNEFETQSQADPTGFHVNVKEVNGTAQTANDNSADINEILLDTAEIGAAGVGLTAVPWNGSWDAEVQSEVNDALVAFFTSADQLVNDIWDEILTGATHNIATSAGRRVREIGAYAIQSGTAQAGDSIHITLAATASATDGIYNRNLLVIVGGTGTGQTRTIVDYVGSTKVTLIDREWRVNPNATSEYQIVPDDTPLVADHGLATAGTANTITLRAYASAVDSIYNGAIITIIAGTGRGQSGIVESYVGSTKVATVCDNWNGTPDNTSVYVMMPYGRAAVACISADALADIKTQADDALSDIKLDHLIAVADGDDPVDNSIIAMMAASDGDWSGFAIADDSLEAIRDRGDAAWITGAGGSPPTTLQNTTIASLATQISFTLIAGSADDDAYNGCIIVVEDSVTATQKCIGRILNYTGASKTITLEADPGVFSMAAGDTVDIIAVELTWDAATKALTDKSGFALSAAGIDAFLDEVIGDAVHATPNSVGAMLHAVYCRFMQKRTATDTVEKSYKLDDITELKSFTLADDDTTTSRT